MPLYEFICKKCGKKFDSIVKFGQTFEKHEECGGLGEKSDTITTHQSYSIGGDNSASITPKRFRKEEK